MYLGDSNITNLDLDNIRVISKTDNILFSAVQMQIFRTDIEFFESF